MVLKMECLPSGRNLVERVVPSTAMHIGYRIQQNTRGRIDRCFARKDDCATLFSPECNAMSSFRG